MRRLSRIVFLEALFELSGHPDMALTLRGETFNKIDINTGSPLR
jgi:hypothetical protein